MDPGLAGGGGRRTAWSPFFPPILPAPPPRPPGTRVDPPGPSTELWLDLVSQQPFPPIRQPSDSPPHFCSLFLRPLGILKKKREFPLWLRGF